MHGACGACTVKIVAERSGRRRAFETGTVIEESPGGQSGGLFCDAAGDDSNIVAARFGVREERRERRTAHHMGAVVWALAIPDGDHVRKVGSDFNTTPVVAASAGFPPHSSRQVGHFAHSSFSMSCSRYVVVSAGSTAASRARSNAWLYVFTCSLLVTS